MCACVCVCVCVCVLRMDIILLYICICICVIYVYIYILKIGYDGLQEAYAAAHAAAHAATNAATQNATKSALHARFLLLHGGWGRSALPPSSLLPSFLPPSLPPSLPHIHAFSLYTHTHTRAHKGIERATTFLLDQRKKRGTHLKCVTLVISES